MRKSLFLSICLLTASTIAAAADLTPAEMSKLAALMDDSVKKNFRLANTEEVRTIAPVMCREGCIVMSQAQMSQALQVMAIVMRDEQEAWATKNCNTVGFSGGAPGSHGGVNKLP